MASGWPPKVLPWSPGPKAAATSARAQHAPTGMPLPSALAMVTTSGSIAAVLEGEPAAGPAQAGLDLVDHQQDVAVRAQLRAAAEVVRRRHDHAGLALDRLDQDGGHPAPDRRPRPGRRGRRRGRGRTPSGIGAKACLLGRLAGGGQGGQGPAVEGVPGRLTTAKRPGPAHRRASLRAHSLASAPELAKKTCPPARLVPPPISRSRVAATSGPTTLPNRLETWQRVRAWVGDGLGHRRVGVAERRHGQARRGSRGSACPRCRTGTLPSPRTKVTGGSA